MQFEKHWFIRFEKNVAYSIAVEIYLHSMDKLKRISTLHDKDDRCIYITIADFNQLTKLVHPAM